MQFQPRKPPPGCVTTGENERKLVELAEKLEAKLEGLLATAGDRIGMTAVTSCAAQIIAARRRAAELSKFREEIEHSDHLAEEMRRMNAGPIKASRPRLERTP